MIKPITTLALVATLLVACTNERKVAEQTLSGLRPQDFEAVVDSVPIGLHVLHGPDGMEACVTGYGARLVSLMVPDADGHLQDVVQGLPTLADYMAHSQNFGATVGRFIGRILGAKYVMDGDTVHLQRGGNGHCGHGGSPNFGARPWRTLRADDRSVTLQYTSPDGENGFPGELTVTLTYALTPQGELDLQYEATTTRATVINLTNHSFFNLSGDLNRPVTDQVLWIRADSITAYDAQKCVTGQYMGVTGTPFDFRTPRTIGERIDEDDAQLQVTKGYDHCWTTGLPLLSATAHAKATDALQPIAWVYDPQSGRRVEVCTTEPGLHVYTANGLKGAVVGKDSLAYERRTAICLETCHYANSPNYPQFPSTTLRPGETWHSHTIYRFSAGREP